MIEGTLNMQVELGAKVVTQDGTEIGKVDRIVIDPEHREVIEIITHKGLFSHDDRIIERGFIASADAETVQLNIADAKVNELPIFASADYIMPEESWDSVMWPAQGEEWGYTTTASEAWMGGGSVLAESSPGSGQYSRITGGSMGAYQLLDTTMEEQSNLPENAVVLQKGTDVFASDDKKLGHLDDLAYDDQGVLTALHIRSGVLRHHETLAPANLIQSMTHERVTLNIDAATARRTLEASQAS